MQLLMRVRSLVQLVKRFGSCKLRRSWEQRVLLLGSHLTVLLLQLELFLVLLREH